MITCSVCHNPGHNRRNTSCPGPAVQERITEEEVSITATEAEDFDDEVQSLELDVFEKEETAQSSEFNSSFFFLHFVDETIVDDEDD